MKGQRKHNDWNQGLKKNSPGNRNQNNHNTNPILKESKIFKQKHYVIEVVNPFFIWIIPLLYEK